MGVWSATKNTMSIASIVRGCLENYSPSWFRSFATAIKFLLILKGLKNIEAIKYTLKTARQ